MFKQLFAGTMKRMFIWVVILCMLGILVLGIYSSTVVSKTTFKQIEKTSLFQMQTASSQMNTLVFKMQSMVEEFEKNKEIFLNNEFDTVVKVNSLFEKVVDIKSVGACFLYTSDGREYSYNPDGIYVDTLQLKMAYGYADNMPYNLKWYNGSDKNTVHQYDNYFIVRTGILEYNDTYTTLYFFVRRDTIDNILNIINDKNNLVFIMNDGELLAVNDRKRFEQVAGSTMDILLLLYETEAGFFNFQKYNEQYITAHFQAPDSNFKFLAIYENAEFYQDGYRIVSVMVLFMVIFTVLVLLLYYMMRIQFINPLNELVNHMDGNFKGNKIQLNGSKEISTLVNQYNYMRDEINKGVDELKLQEEKKRQAEIAALRYQIRPHFLYNTLSNIKILAMSKGQEEISLTISKLAKMYRYLLSGKSDYVKLSEEMDFINNYVALMNIRYDNRLNTFFLVDENLKECKLPTFLLQPIVENSIVHGLSKRLNKKIECLLRIKIFREDEFLVMEVYDDGEGIPIDKLNKILSMKDNDIQEFGVGLYNTISRLKHQYGEKYEFEIESVENQYTQIIIKIPFEIE